MSHRADEIRRRIAKRKRERLPSNLPEKKREPSSFLVKDEEKFGHDHFPSFEGGSGNDAHPLFSKEVFMFKILASVCIVLIVAILFKNGSANLDPARNFVSKTMENDFQFAAISTWYQEQFGNPLAFFPTPEEKDAETETAEGEKTPQFAVPATGRVTESFQDNGQGVMVETGSNSAVEAMNSGTVTFAGTKDNLGKTIIIQHADGSQSWYGNLESIKVPLYTYVKAGDEVGKVTDTENEKGMFYFAIKQGETFIDPIQVIKFD
ncbi:M23 family metallopeptidase [Bacillus sp. PS06]|uniref:M23 family metallopeptidase n=1 Tax=Bacillus sp. PS06 TaxID=2764176 RepID=UPI00178717EA|nr:M23 family metallopeptidase [Bacillus sp. PS06]MBD8069348.1 M23 family metallopeptidase [Bacillus sp. PS06]